jgi:hypothetical protein
MIIYLNNDVVLFKSLSHVIIKSGSTHRARGEDVK